MRQRQTLQKIGTALASSSPTLRAGTGMALTVGGVIGMHRWWTKPLRSLAGVAPDLPGQRRMLVRTYGTVSYRYHMPHPGRPVTIFVHGWGGSADTSWWRILASYHNENFIAVDLPGHGYSELANPFTFELASHAIHSIVAGEHLADVTLVGNSMGGPISLDMLAICQERGCNHHVKHLMMIATSAFWVRPRVKLLIGLGPYLTSSISPVPAAMLRANAKATPDWADIHVWGAQQRPARKVLVESSRELKRYDLRRKKPETLQGLTQHLKTATWLIATQDGVINPIRQRRSAELFEADIVEIEAHHSLSYERAEAVLDMLNNLNETGAVTVTQPTLVDKISEQ